MCPSPVVLHNHGLPATAVRWGFIPKCFFPYETASQQSHPSSLSMMGVLLSRSRQDKVHTHPSLCCKVLLQVLRVQAVSHGTRGPTDTCSHTGMSGESRMWVPPSQAGVLAREICPELSEEVWGAPWETTWSTRAGVWMGKVVLFPVREAGQEGQK